MTPETRSDAISPEYGAYSWLETWRSALTRPNEETFRSLVNDPNGSLGRALSWIAISSAISYLITTSLPLLFSSLLAGPSFLDVLEHETGLFLGGGWMVAGVYGCGLPLVVIISTVGMLIYSSVVQVTASAFGGEATLASMMYALAAFTAPLTVLIGVISWIPQVNCLAIPLGIYSMLLTLLAVKSVNRMSWGKTISVFAALLLVGALLAVILGWMIWIPIRDNLLTPGGLYGVPY